MYRPSFVTLFMGLAVAATCTASQSVRAACRDKVLPFSEATMVGDAAQRLKSLGVDRVVPVGTIAKKDYYRLDGSKVRLFFVPDAGKITDIGVLLDQPAGRTDGDMQTTLAAFVLSRIAATPEAAIKAQLSNAIAARPNEDRWTENFGSTTAVVTKTTGLLLILIGQIDCT